MKPGYKTTEFWLSVAAMVIGALIASGVFGDASMAGKVLAWAASALAALGYSVSRGLVKHRTAATEALLMAKEKAPLGDPS